MAKPRKAPQPEEVQGTIKQLIQQTLREALEAELEEFLGYPRYQLQIRITTATATSGEPEIKVPRDRKGNLRTR